MGHPNYEKGRRKEWKIKKQLEMQGLTVLRSAGSKGFADLVAIDKKEHQIRFIQCKPDDFAKSEEAKLMEEHGFFNNGPIFETSFEVI